MSTTVAPDDFGTGRAATAGQRVVDAATTRLFRLPPQRGGYAVTSSIPVLARDGARLLTEHFAPDGPALGTVLMRSPYQRVGVMSQILAGLYALRGYHVVLQSCRGTFGSDGEYTPGVAEIDDGAATLAWLREQPWYDGRLALVGGSALSYPIWAMLVDPPPELVAVAGFASFHDPSPSPTATAPSPSTTATWWPAAWPVNGSVAVLAPSPNWCGRTVTGLRWPRYR